eukprot:832122-Rhodomonas_salina.1
MAETESDEGTRKRRESEPDARCDSAPSSDRLLIQEGEASDQDASLALEHPAVTRKEVRLLVLLDSSAADPPPSSLIRPPHLLVLSGCTKPSLLFQVDAWMMVEWSNSPYSTVAISAFLP